jgi:predicted homoserine dehydrogenase-like protein
MIVINIKDLVIEEIRKGYAEQEKSHMIFGSLFEQAGNKQINAGLIGAGTYGISLLAQAQRISHLNIPVICGKNPQTPRKACMHAGIPEDIITICSNFNQIRLAMEKDRCLIAENYKLMLERPIDAGINLIDCADNMPRARADVSWARPFSAIINAMMSS